MSEDNGLKKSGHIDLIYDVLSNHDIPEHLRKSYLRLFLEDITKFEEYFMSHIPDANEKDGPWLSYLPSQKINAIKEYRHIYGVGLKEAKDAIDEYCAKKGW